MKPTPVQFAVSYERTLAMLVDSVLLSFPKLLLLSITGNTGLLAGVAQFAVYAAYFAYFESSSWQATPGKRLFKIHIINVNGTALTKREALARVIAFMMRTFPLHVSFLGQDTAMMLTIWLMLVWFIPMLTMPQKTGMHDILCRTRVLKGIKSDRLTFK